MNDNDKTTEILSTIGGKITSLDLDLDIDDTITWLDHILTECYNSETRTCIYKDMEFYSYAKYSTRSQVLSYYILNFIVRYETINQPGNIHGTLIELCNYLKYKLVSEYNTEDIMIISIQRNLNDIIDLDKEVLLE